MTGYKLIYDYKSYTPACAAVTTYRGMQAGHYIKDMGTPEKSLQAALERFKRWAQYPAGKRYIKNYASGPALVSVNRCIVSIMYNFRLEKDGASV